MKEKMYKSDVIKMKDSAQKKQKMARLISKAFLHDSMPTFKMYSILNKHLLKKMLIKVAEIAEIEISDHKENFFNYLGRL